MGNQSEPNAIGPQNTLDLIARRPLATDKVQMIMSFVATSAQKTYRSGRKDGILFYTFRDITHWADIETPERGGGSLLDFDCREFEVSRPGRSAIGIVTTPYDSRVSFRRERPIGESVANSSYS